MTQHKDILPDAVRQQILDAAGQRFQQYGYSKTTMAEIAKDCDMSAANLYRYFENKLAIGAALACNCLDENIEQLRVILQDSTSSSSERLHRFVTGLLDSTYRQWSEVPRINEMVMAICEERMDIVNHYHQQKQEMLSVFLEESHDRGEFNVPDPQKTASAILTAVTLFKMPLFMPMFSREAFEQKARNLAELLLNGLLKH
jgi:AcrR family transcriptional regulator